jgi:hypothetical protein
VKFIVVSKKKLWKTFNTQSPVSQDYIRNHYAGTPFYDPVNEFVSNSQPGQYLEVDDTFYFNVTEGFKITD